MESTVTVVTEWEENVVVSVLNGEHLSCQLQSCSACRFWQEAPFDGHRLELHGLD